MMLRVVFVWIVDLLRLLLAEIIVICLVCGIIIITTSINSGIDRAKNGPTADPTSYDETSRSRWTAPLGLHICAWETTR
jgi:hypothetical protein